MMTDPIADMLTRIRNAVAIERPFVDIPMSGEKEGIAQVLQQPRLRRHLVCVRVVTALRNVIDARRQACVDHGGDFLEIQGQVIVAAVVHERSVFGAC